MSKKPFVLCIAGTSGSGKTTLAKKVSLQLNNAPLLSLDDYFKYLEGWPSDIRKWLDQGGKMADLRNPKMIQDIQTLLKGESIIYPTTNEEVFSNDFIIIEDPSGKERQELAVLIDYLIFIDLPQDIGLLRIIQRMINSTTEDENGKFTSLRDTNPELLISKIQNFLDQYSFVYRDLYTTVCETVKQQADLILDGLKDINALTIEVIKMIPAQQ